MKFAPYSVSKIQCFEQCPKKFEYNYIQKIKTPRSFYHLEKGSLWHSLIEHKIKNNIKQFKKPKFKELSELDYLNELANCVKFIKSKFFSTDYLDSQMFYSQKTEQYFCIDENGKCSFTKQKKPMMRGYIDLIQYCDYDAEVIDWKTGGKKQNLTRFPKSNFQLDIYAYVVNQILGLEKITGKYVFVEHEYEQIKTNFNYLQIWNDLIEKINKIESTEVFEPKEQVLCDWCEFRGICEIGG